MIRLLVKKTIRDGVNGNIVGLIGTDEFGSTYEHSSYKVIRNIENRECNYYIRYNGQHNDVLVKERNGSKYLTTAKNETDRDNLLYIESV